MDLRSSPRATDLLFWYSLSNTRIFVIQVCCFVTGQWESLRALCVKAIEKRVRNGPCASCLTRCTGHSLKWDRSIEHRSIISHDAPFVSSVLLRVGGDRGFPGPREIPVKDSGCSNWKALCPRVAYMQTSFHREIMGLSALSFLSKMTLEQFDNRGQTIRKRRYLSLTVTNCYDSLKIREANAHWPVVTFLCSHLHRSITVQGQLLFLLDLLSRNWWNNQR